IACTHINLKHAPEAIIALKQALTICEELGAVTIGEKCCAALMELYEHQGNRRSSLDYVAKRAKYLQAQGRNDELLGTLDELIHDSQLSDAHDDTIAYMKKALAVVPAGDERQIAERYLELGAALGRRGIHNEAVVALTQAVSRFNALKDEANLAHGLRH